MKVSVSIQDPSAWLKKANSDLIVIRMCLTNEETLDAAAYHAQQVAEKALKAFVVFHLKDVKKTHDLEYLVDVCSRFDFSFIQLRDYAARLNGYVTYSRYPDDYFTIDLDEAKVAYKRAKHIFDFVAQRLPAEVPKGV